MKSVTYPYLPNRQNSLMPYLPVQLEQQGRVIETMALVDSGAVSSILPYSMGLALGLDWQSAQQGLDVIGAVVSPSKNVRAVLHIPQFSALETGFSWVEDDNKPLILGQRIFFYQFQVQFDGRQPSFTLTRQEQA